MITDRPNYTIGKHTSIRGPLSQRTQFTSVLLLHDYIYRGNKKGQGVCGFVGITLTRLKSSFPRNLG